MDYASLLAQHDHPTHWEYPPGFDYAAATARFGRFMADLSAALGQPVPSETGSYIQDASFHSQASLPLPDGRQATIRFSNFGDMVTVDNNDLVPEPVMAVVLELFIRHGYTYIPAAVLDADYTGSNPGVTGIQTWWIRYFDWV
ncbi:MAG: hypothetical protein U0804_04265 [Gemmataceae bacterium]